jgi:ribonucleotide reductase beta subunit family protein with ferritin-like domain
MEARTDVESAQARSAKTLSEIARQEGFMETSDPALQESADRGKAKLLSYKELYLLWERQQWATQELDFTQDRIDWHERIPPEERFQRMYGLSGFFIGEQRVTDELGPIMRACPLEEQRIFLSTQIADEAAMSASSIASTARWTCMRAPTASRSGSPGPRST